MTQNPANTYVVWFEIPITDIAKTLSFYENTFGWILKKFTAAPEKSRSELWHIYINEHQSIGGLYQQEKRQESHGIEIYLSVANVQATIDSALHNHGRIDLAKTKRPDGPGYYARIIDPDNNIIGIWGLN